MVSSSCLKLVRMNPTQAQPSFGVLNEQQQSILSSLTAPTVTAVTFSQRIHVAVREMRHRKISCMQSFFACVIRELLRLSTAMCYFPISKQQLSQSNQFSSYQKSMNALASCRRTVHTTTYEPFTVLFFPPYYSSFA